MPARSGADRMINRKQRDAVFRALADPTRREILNILRGGRQTVGEIAGNFRMSRPAISKHLRLLRSAGLVVTRQEGTSRHCGLNAKPLRAIDDWLQDYETFWSDTIVQEITINGPAERIFDALTNPGALMKWWGVEGWFQATHVDSDLRPGGKWMMRLDVKGGKPTIVGGEYRTIERPRLLVFTWIREPENAPETLVRWDLEEKDGVTTVRLTHSGLTSESLRTRNSGWPKILALLQAYIEESK
jgi:uncharacterized protein YndB with AHSA1/START domain/DNA-binding transcriptional ArsR family regulator